MGSSTLIIGAGPSGLATAACLQRKGIPFVIVEKAAAGAASWRSHYDRLHLHTSKQYSHLPFLPFDKNLPRYPSRDEVVQYLLDYESTLQIPVQYNTIVTKLEKWGEGWKAVTANGELYAQNVVVATGPFSRPVNIDIPGIEKFSGKVLHSQQYTTGALYKGQKVLVVGFGNSACEIALDLQEQGALPSVAVRSPVNVVPRDILGIPILQVSLWMRWLKPSLADKLNAPLLRLMVGDIEKLGLRKKSMGPLEQIAREGKAPVLDIGTIALIRSGKLCVYPGIQAVDGQTVHFSDGRSAEFDVIVAALGYRTALEDWIELPQERFDDLRRSTAAQQFFGKDGLYFCGFWISPTGQLREIGIDANRIANAIAITR